MRLINKLIVSSRENNPREPISFCYCVTFSHLLNDKRLHSHFCYSEVSFGIEHKQGEALLNRIVLRRLNRLLEFNVEDFVLFIIFFHGNSPAILDLLRMLVDKLLYSFSYDILIFLIWMYLEAKKWVFLAIIELFFKNLEYLLLCCCFPYSLIPCFLNFPKYKLRQSMNEVNFDRKIHTADDD